MKNKIIYIYASISFTIFTIAVYHYLIISPYITKLDSINNNLITITNMDPQICNCTKEINTYLITNTKADFFMKSFFDSDINSLKNIVDDNITITADGFAFDDDPETSIPFFWTNKLYNFELNNFEYIEPQNIIKYFYRIYKGNVPEAFITIELQLSNEKWKIHNIEVDI